MAARCMQLLCLSCIICMVLHVCLLQGVFGDVPDDVVYTDLHKTVRKGDSVVLTCRFRGTPLAVWWKKGDDPETAPNLVSWIPTDDVTGLCEGERPCQIMEMNENHSLVIKEVSIAEQGRYICRVTIRGILIHNFTDIRVFSPPMEPFPIINVCQVVSPINTETPCTISTSHSVKISCSASGYYPDIDLHFLHGSTSLPTKDTTEVSNLDGTKNKTIFAIASASDSGYFCFASNIPGLQEQRTTTVLVNLPETPSSIPTGLVIPTVTRYRNQTNQTTIAPIDNTDGSVTKVVVAVLVVILILAAMCVAIIVWRWRKHRRYQEIDDQESRPPSPDPQINDDQELRPPSPDPQINGKVSFFELWYLVNNMDQTNLNILRGALVKLGIPVVEEELPADKAYELLCDWKDTNKLDNEGMGLNNVLRGHGLSKSWRDVCELIHNTESAVSKELLDHILWSIGDEISIRNFFRELIADKRQTRPNVSGNKGDVIAESMVVLMEWRDKEQKERQVIQLSLALERAKCKPEDRTFFKVPEHLMKAISPEEVEGFVYRLTGRHCKRLAKAVGITDEKKIATIMDANNKDLILIQSMVNDWVDGQECCNYEKRCMLDAATIDIGRHDMTDSFGTTSYRVERGGILEKPHPNAKTFNSSSIFDDDLYSMLWHLPTCARPLFIEKLGISVDEGCDEQKLRCWRDNNIKESKRYSLQDLMSIHSDALIQTNDSHVPDLMDDELDHLINSMTAIQVEELASKLRIKLEKEPSPYQHIKQWWDRCKIDERNIMLRKALCAMELSGCIVDRVPAKHVYQAELVRLAWTMFAIDVWPLTTLPNMNKVKTVGEPQMRGTVHLLIQLLDNLKGLAKNRRRDFCVAIRNLGYPDVARSAYFGYDASLSELCNMTSGLSEDKIVRLVKHLGLEKDLLSIYQGTTGAYDNVKLMKIWKNQLRREPFHFRFKLALGLADVGRDEIASRILAGGHHTIEVDYRVVESICNSLEGDELERLREHLGVKAQDGQTTSTATLVTEWVRYWLKEFDELSTKQLMDNLDSRGNKIDNLFKVGFVKLAEEVMLLEISRFLRATPANTERGETPSVHRT